MSVLNLLSSDEESSDQLQRTSEETKSSQEEISDDARPKRSIALHNYNDETTKVSDDKGFTHINVAMSDSEKSSPAKSPVKNIQLGSVSNRDSQVNS